MVVDKSSTTWTNHWLTITISHAGLNRLAPGATYSIQSTRLITKWPTAPSSTLLMSLLCPHIWDLNGPKISHNFDWSFGICVVIKQCRGDQIHKKCTPGEIGQKWTVQMKWGVVCYLSKATAANMWLDAHSAGELDAVDDTFVLFLCSLCNLHHHCNHQWW